MGSVPGAWIFTVNPASSDGSMSGTAGSSCFLQSSSTCSVILSAGVSGTCSPVVVSGLGAGWKIQEYKYKVDYLQGTKELETFTHFYQHYKNKYLTELGAVLLLII